MPEAVTYVLAYAASSAGVAVGSTALIAAGYIVTAAAVVGYSSSQRRKAKRKAIDAYNASLSDRLVMTALANGRRSRVYGRVRNVDGVVFKQTHGTNNQYYTLVISLAGHEVDAIETIYFGDVPVTLDGDGYVLTAPWAGSKVVDAQAGITITGGSGSVVLPNTPIAGSVSVVSQTSGALDEQTYSVTPSVTGSTVTVSGAPVDGAWLVNYQYSQSTPKARVRKYLGGPSQDLYADLSAVVGTAQLLPTDKFAGDASLIVTLQYDQDAFPTGVPQISAVMRGAKVYDPRTGSTAWTENPALIARDWALYEYGGGAGEDELIVQAFVAAANACDVSTTFTTDAGSEVRPLYQCGIVCPLDADPSATLDEIVESMAGHWGWAGGNLTLRAGVYRAPVAAIDEIWVTNQAEISVVAQAPTSDLVNVMRPTIADAAQNYVAAPTAEVRYTAAITADGRELPREVEFNGVTHAVHAQHISGVTMRDSREALTVKLPCNMRALQLELFDVVTLTLPTFGWAAKEFEVLGWSFSIDGGVILTLRETAAAIFDPDTGFATLDVAANTLLPKPSEVEQITGVNVTSGTSAEVDKSILVRTTVSWTAAVSEAVRRHGRIEVQYTHAGVALPSGDWPKEEVAGDATSAVIAGLGQGVHYLFRVRAVNNLGVRGLWSVTKTSQNAVVPAITGVRTVTGSSISVTGYWRNDTVPFTLVNSWSTVVSDTFTPLADCDVEFTVDGYVSLTPGAGSGAFDYAAAGYSMAYTKDGGSETSVNGFNLAAASGKAYLIPIKYMRRITCTGGVSTTLAFRMQRNFSGDSLTVQDVEMRITAIYR